MAVSEISAKCVKKLAEIIMAEQMEAAGNARNGNAEVERLEWQQ